MKICFYEDFFWFFCLFVFGTEVWEFVVWPLKCYLASENGRKNALVDILFIGLYVCENHVRTS